MRSTDKFGRSLDAWSPPDTAVDFVHSSINYCDEMDTHNAILDYDAAVTGTTGATGHSLSNIATHDFDTYWQADSAVADNDQYFELELDEAREVDSCIMNFHIPYAYTTSPYTPDMSCWKAWTLKGRLNASDAWTTLETVTANSIKFYRGAFTSGTYKYFRVDGISAYDDQAQTSRIDAYLYTMGLYDSDTKYNDAFPDQKRGRNDYGTDAESTKFADNTVYIERMVLSMADVYDMNGEIRKAIKGDISRKYRHIGGLRMEFAEDPGMMDYTNNLALTRLFSLDFTANSGVCMYMFPPPDEMWWIVNTGYGFDETSANLNTDILVRSADNAHKLSPSYTTLQSYGSFSTLAARFVNTVSGIFKVNTNFISFNDPVNMDTPLMFDGQENNGRMTTMDGTALTNAVNASSSLTFVRLKVGSVWRGYQSTLTFNPPIKLDGDVATDLFEMRKSEKVKGSILRYTLHGFRVPK